MAQLQILNHLKQMREWEATSTPPISDPEAYIKEILETWAPMAERLEMHQEQSELQELAIKLGYPDDYKYLKRLLLESEMTCEMVFRTFSLPICAMLDELGIEYQFTYRMKSVYSIWRKMRVKGRQFDDVYDLFATRIIYKPQTPSLLRENVNAISGNEEINTATDEVLNSIDAENATCWRIYTIIAMLYRIQTERTRDWITKPRPSGYQALQLTVMGPDCNWVEIQIRSQRMHHEAEYGSAAHWKYKDGFKVQ